jgi:hypothetical protein
MRQGIGDKAMKRAVFALIMSSSALDQFRSLAPDAMRLEYVLTPPAPAADG